MVRALIKEPGILVNEPDEYGNTPLHLAMMNENLCTIAFIQNWLNCS